MYAYIFTFVAFWSYEVPEVSLTSTMGLLSLPSVVWEVFLLKKKTEIYDDDEVRYPIAIVECLYIWFFSFFLFKPNWKLSKECA